MKIICLLLIALYLLSVKWRISVKLKLNSIDKEGNLCIKLFGTKIFALKVEFDVYNSALKIRFIGKIKLLRFNLNAGNEDSLLYFTKSFDRNLISWIDCKKVYLNAEIGCSDVLYGIMLTQVLRITYAALISILKCGQKIDNYERIVPKFDGEIFNFDFEALFEICIVNLIIYFFKNIFERIKNRYRSKYAY